MTVPDERVAGLLGLYGAPDACAAGLLCDRHRPDARALRILGPDLAADDLTYGELRADSERFAAVLHGLGLRAGDRVATLMGKSRDYLVVLMGIWRLGAVHVPLFTAFAPPAIAQRLLGSGAKVAVCDADQLAKLQPGEDIPASAPVGLFFTMEREMALGAWLDVGMFMQNVMVLARAHGLESCPQQAWCTYGAVVHRELAIPDEHILLSGMALGFADESAGVNTLVSTRVGLDEFATWHR